MKRFSNYGGHIIATSVVTSAGKPFHAAFTISRSAPGADEEVIHTEYLERTFAFAEEARAAANLAAQAFVDSLAG